MRRPPPLRFYAYVLGTVWAVIGIMFAAWALAAGGPGWLVIVPVFAAVTIAGVVAVRTQL